MTGPIVGADSISLQVVGELDLATAPLLVTAATSVLGGQQQPAAGVALELDLSGLTFLDTTGLRALNHTAGLLAAAVAAPVRLVQATSPVLLLLTHAASAGWIVGDIDCTQLAEAGHDMLGGDR